MMMYTAAHTAVHAPALLSEVWNWFLKSVKIIAVVLIAGIIIWRQAAAWWAVLLLLALGVFVIPSTTPKINQLTEDVTKGSAVGGTGASMGLLVMMAAMVVIMFFMLSRGGGGGEE